MDNGTLSRDESIAKELLQAKCSVFSSLNIGKETLEALDEQGETLRGVEDTLEANENLVDKSMVTLRGMTWSGFLYNQCVTTKEVLLRNASGNAPPVTATNLPVVASKRNETSSSVSTSVPLSDSRNKDDLEEISSAVATLHKMGLEIGNQLDTQNSIIESIAEKTDNLTEKTLAVTIRASQLRDRARSTKPQFGGIYQFIDTVTGQYLAVIDGRLILTHKLNRSTYFNCYVKESNLFAMQSEKTQKYVGCAMLGHIIVESAYFGTQEECYIDFKAKTTGILFLARHWGAGAWLKRPLSTAAVAAAESSTPSPPPPTSHPYLTETTLGIEDKTDFIEFRPVKLATKDKVED